MAEGAGHRDSRRRRGGRCPAVRGGPAQPSDSRHVDTDVGDADDRQRLLPGGRRGRGPVATVGVHGLLDDDADPQRHGHAVHGARDILTVMAGSARRGLRR